jgi:hypothetical protein
MPDGFHDRRDTLLGPAYAAAHRALGRLEDEDVPAQLRSIRAASKKKSLPRPFRAVLARHLDEEWLRALAAAELTEGDSPADQASRLFLIRPDGWQDEVDRLVALDAERMERIDSESLHAENERLARLLDELGERLRQSEERLKSLERQSTNDERVEALRRRVETELRARTDAEREIGERDGEIERLKDEIAEADERIGVLRSRVNRALDRGGAAARGDRTFGRGSPLDIARLLDELMETMRPRPGEEAGAVEASPLELPPGVRPDTADAIEWIRTLERPVMILVDGHNVAHDFGPEPGRTDRDRVVSETARLRRLGDGPISAVVFFDSANDIEAHRNHGVAVRYVPDADAAIEDAVAAARIDCIVISTDKDVRRRAAAHGAVTLWGTAFSDWIARR